MELLYDRIDRAERLADNLKRQTAPTVPQYDLAGGAPTWTLRSSPWDDPGQNSIDETVASIWSETMGLFLALTGEGPPYWITSPDAITWTPYDHPTGFNLWSDYYGNLGLNDSIPLVASVDETSIWTTSDGVAWTQIHPTYNPRCITYSPDLNMWVVGNQALGGATQAISTSHDTLTWTDRVTPWDTAIHQSMYVKSICWSPDLNLFVGIGFNPNDSNTVLVSSNGISWTGYTSPSDMLGNSTDVIWAPVLGKFVATCLGFGGPVVATSPDGQTWTAISSPLDEDGHCALEVNGRLYLGGERFDDAHSLYVSDNGGSTWTDTMCPLSTCTSLSYSPSLRMLVAFGQFHLSPDGNQQIATLSPI